MPTLTRQQKITFGEMREGGVRGVLIYCSDYKFSHWTALSADRWPDDVRLKTSSRKSIVRRNKRPRASAAARLSASLLRRSIC
jgi:hypothetical protein